MTAVVIIACVAVVVITVLMIVDALAVPYCEKHRRMYEGDICPDCEMEKEQ